MWTFGTAWAIAKLIGILAAVAMIVTPALRLRWEGREYRARRRKRK